MRLIRWLLGLTAVCVAAQAGAAYGAVSVSPNNLSASLRSTLPVTLVWTVNLPAPDFSSLVLSSPQGTVSTPAGQILQIDPIPLTVRLSNGRGSVLETFTLSPSTVAAALRLGINTLYLNRTFTPYGGSAAAVIHLVGSAAGPLALTRVSLYFDNRSLLRVLKPGESLTAVAEIDYSGNGVLNGLWEVASPPSTLGEPVFVPLASATANLTAGGRTLVTSPPLPAAASGTYFVRFVVRSPAVPFTGLVIEYAVEGGVSAPPITIIKPGQNATLNADTLFQWMPVAGAVAYRLEFYNPDAAESSRPVSGEWVPAQRPDAVLSVLAHSHLQAGRFYRWRLVALDSNGHIIGSSSFYAIGTP